MVTVMYGSGLHAEDPHDVLCGRCGDVLLRERTHVTAWAFLESGDVTVDDVEHWCDPGVVYKALMVVAPSADVAALVASIPT